MVSDNPTYNHMFTIAFCVPGSTSPTGEDVTHQDLQAAILQRLLDVTEEAENGGTDLTEVVGCPDDSYEEHDAPDPRLELVTTWLKWIDAIMKLKG